jgi:diadenosine tetraphosphate (Ap4A) HIT family hydrolase
MAETPEEMYARVKDDLRSPSLEGWYTWPFEGVPQPKALDPLTPEPEIAGAGGVNCQACDAADDEYIWSDEHWRLLPPRGPSGLPVVVLLEPRAHCASFADMPEDLLAQIGPMTARVERAVLSVGGIGKVHIGRWGEGAEHFHLWFIARPEGFGQLRSSFNEIWDEVLPPTPEPIWRANLEQVARAMA